MIRGKTRQPLIKRFIIYPLQAVLLFIIYGIFKLLPAKIAARTSARLFAIIGPRTPKQKIILKNLKIVFPDLEAHEKRSLIKKIWRNIGAVFGEAGHLIQLSDQVKIEGLENIPRDESGNFQQCLFMAGHVSNWELSANVLTKQHIPLAIIYREANNPLSNWLMVNIRKKYGGELIAKGSQGARELISAIKNKKSVLMLVDQKMNDGIAVPFFGVPAMTAPAIATLALKNDLPIIPIRTYRDSTGQYRLRLFPALSMSGDETAIMTGINSIMEQWILETPDQWLWIHNRWPKNLV